MLNTATKRYRFNGGTPDPDGKLFYTVTTEIDKQLEHYDIGKPKYTVIDLAQQKIVKTVDVAPEDENGAVGSAMGATRSRSPPMASCSISSATRWSS